MPADMKELIARAAVKLLFEENKNKLTVKDIVDECHITRQTFYYHFEDIPHLLEWILQKGLVKMKEEAREKGNIKDRMQYLFLMAVQIQPYIRKSLGTNYGEELERMLKKEVLAISEETIWQDQLYQGLTHEELSLLVRYHTQAVMGLLRDWTESDSKNLDNIVDITYKIMSGNIVFSPQDSESEDK